MIESYRTFVYLVPIPQYVYNVFDRETSINITGHELTNLTHANPAMVKPCLLHLITVPR